MRRFLLSALLLAGCSAAPPPAEPVKDMKWPKEGVSFQVPNSWTETNENNVHSARAADGFSLVTVTVAPKSGLTLAEYSVLAAQSMKSYVKQDLHGPDPVTVHGLKGLQSYGEAQMETHPGTALLTTLEGKDKYYAMLGLICDQGNSSNRLKLLHDMANSLQETSP